MCLYIIVYEECISVQMCIKEMRNFMRLFKTYTIHVSNNISAYHQISSMY